MEVLRAGVSCDHVPCFGDPALLHLAVIEPHEAVELLDMAELSHA